VDKNHRASENDVHKEEVEEESASYRPVGKEEKRDIEEDEEVGDEGFVCQVSADHGDADDAAVENIVWDEEDFNGEGGDEGADSH
jgi:hypothetical protein